MIDIGYIALMVGAILVFSVIELLILLHMLKQIRNRGITKTVMETPMQLHTPSQQTISKAPEVLEPKTLPQEQEPEPTPETFVCKKCKKEFTDKKKLQRHIGMAHYKDLEI